MPGGTTILDSGSKAMDSALAITGVSAVKQDIRFADIDGAGVTTVIIDTGIDLDHPFFGLDADGNGIADRILYQYDFADDDADASDLSGHGSHVSSMIGSQDAVYQGVAPGADLIILKVFEDSGQGYFSYLEEALQWVVANQEAYHIGVVNLSLGDGGFWTDTFSRYGIGDELATLSHSDVITVGAAGNYYSNRLGVAYPASDPAVIAVGATWAMDLGGPWRTSTGATNYITGVDHIAAFSQRDDELLDVFAPGARFNGASADGGIKTLQGTSQAAAFVSGVATLCQQVAQEELGRGLTTAEFVLLLKETTDLIIDGDDEIDNVLNTGLEFGRINFQALVERILTLEEIPLGSDNGSDTGGFGNLVQQAAPGVHQVSLTAGQNAGGVDFGNHLDNQAPVAAADSASTKQLIAVVIDVLANDHDPDGDPLTVIGFTQPRHGQVIDSGNGTLTYTPHTGYSGLDSFTYTNSDNKGGTATAPVDVAVTYAPPYTSRRRLPSPPPPPPPPLPLEAASLSTTTAAGPTLTTAALEPIVAQALSLWGGSLTPADLEVTIADLPGARLGQAGGHTITLDLNAAGHGWFIDPTPFDNLEFSLTRNAEEFLAQDFSPAFGKIDLLTVVTHELGHVLGFGHASQGVMAPTLATGERQTPIAPNQAPPKEKVVLFFDEDKGELAPPVLPSTQVHLRAVKFDPALWRNPAVSQDNGEDDWIVDFGPRKIRRSG